MMGVVTMREEQIQFLTFMNIYFEKIFSSHCLVWD